jgi:4-amino-4-deoxy-L-arabinose transferase-like glycosyltransferase
LRIDKTPAKLNNTGMQAFFTGLWKVLLTCPPLFLGLIILIGTAFTLDARALWFSDEIRYGAVFQEFVHQGKRLVLYLNGVPYPDKPPGYFWFLYGLLPFVGEIGTKLFMLGAALSGWLFVTASYGYARLVAGADKTVAFCAGLLILSAFYCLGLMQYSRMDLLFAALITTSHILLYKALLEEKAYSFCTAGFFTAGLAVLVKGPLGFAFPMVTAAVFLAQQKRITRLFRSDVLLGLFICALLVGGWLLSAWLAGETAFVENIFHKQLYERAVEASHHRQPWWYYIAFFPVAWLPWAVLLFFLPWRKKSIAKRTGTKARKMPSGMAYTWCTLLSGFLLLSVVSIKIIVYTMPLIPALAVLSANFLLDLCKNVSRVLFGVVSALLLVIALAAPFANELFLLPSPVEGLWLVAAATFLLAALIFASSRMLETRHSVLVCALSIALWTIPLIGKTAASLDDFMSPKAQAALMGEYIAKGYAPAAYKVYSGTYTYYARQGASSSSDLNIWETKDLDALGDFVREKPKAVVGMRKKYWDQWEDKPQGLRVVHEQIIVNRAFVLTVSD